MGFFGGLKKERTKVIASMLFEVEMFLGAQVAAAANVLAVSLQRTGVTRKRQADSCSAAIAEQLRDQAVTLARRNSIPGIQTWPLLVVEDSLDLQLASLIGAVEMAAQFRESDRGVTSGGKECVRQHYSLLNRIRHSLNGVKEQDTISDEEADGRVLETLVSIADDLEDRAAVAAQLAGLAA